MLILFQLSGYLMKSHMDHGVTLALQLFQIQNTRSKILFSKITLRHHNVELKVTMLSDKTAN